MRLVIINRSHGVSVFYTTERIIPLCITADTQDEICSLIMLKAEWM